MKRNRWTGNPMIQTMLDIWPLKQFTYFWKARTAHVDYSTLPAVLGGGSVLKVYKKKARYEIMILNMASCLF